MAIKYPSAMHRGGATVVFFDASKCEIGHTSLLKIIGIDIEFTEDTLQLTGDYPNL